MSTVLEEQLAHLGGDGSGDRSLLVESEIVIVDDQGNEEPYVSGELK
ncbi:hypothetical protein [Kitasatospora viridis]|uniref:Uncharacterized protein n=1 Tax=Kitasatospora viridis TaxID=281105 RepID=A0A561UL31_9ACTN|nr:hypothetical protein [Kitasatospora viridis]TWG00057.1 hypothetical protein FHX73_113923 [Kitasatospora viridis]